MSGINRRKAIIAMSGGVDSSVAAYLTYRKGDECLGATMQLFGNEDIGEEKEKSCCSLSDVEDARRVAYRIGFPFYVFNFKEDFRREVMDRFAQAYWEGKTPNPCIDCNRHMKFDRLLGRMREIGYDYIVTGHYARVAFDEASGRFLLKKGLDPGKDQSYVLYNLTQEQLSCVEFPLGAYTKAEVRRIAQEQGFVNARKHDSQDICFVPDGDYASFIESYTGRKAAEGDFVDKDGFILGRHRGIIHYTIGQRRGLAIPASRRLYVCRLDMAANRVVLGDNADLFSRELVATDVNLIACDRLDEPRHLKAKIRYRHPEMPCTAWQDAEGKLHVRFDQDVRAITRGQAVVLYDEDVVVGGGVID